ncbi:MAG: sugar phosphate isomerase/epimerase [Caldilineaceae bacterium]|nr:sugar phosphate isomerase/epimerase [Caldilineaceae bacterium]
MIIGNPMIFRQYPLDRAVRMLPELGYQGAELWAPQIAICKTAALRHQLADFVQSTGLTLTGVNAADADYFSALAAPGDLEAVLAGLQRDIDLVHTLGGDYLLTWEGRKPAGATHDERFGWLLDTTVDLFRAAVAYAQRKQVKLFVEVHPYTLGIDLDFLIRLCDRVDSDAFGVTYDCCHFGVGLPNHYIDAIYRLEHRIKHLHFSDSDKVSSELHFAPGTGGLDLEGILNALRTIHFQGPVMLDLWLYPFPEEGSRLGLAYLQDKLQL